MRLLGFQCGWAEAKTNEKGSNTYLRSTTEFMNAEIFEAPGQAWPIFGRCLTADPELTNLAKRRHHRDSLQ
jgi:hypothetical protein